MPDRFEDNNCHCPPLLTEYIFVIKQNNEFIGVEERDYVVNRDISSKDILKTIKKRKKRRRRRKNKRKHRF